MEFLCSRNGGNICIVGVPYDGTSCFRPGSRFAPDGIRFFSHNLEDYSPVLKRSLCDLPISDLGNIEVPSHPEGMFENVHSMIQKIDIPVVLGGEHSITFPVVKALKERYGKLTVVQFDAHADLREEYLGTRLSHACVMRRIIELGCEVVQVGIRSGTEDEFNLMKEIGSLVDLKELPDFLWAVNSPVYFTVDIDFFDPAFAPGTGTPEPCGYSPLDFFKAIYNLHPLNVVGLDVVEVSPPYDPSGITQMLAAKVLRELMLKFFGG